MKKVTKKGQAGLVNLIKVLVLAGLMLGLGLLVLDKFWDQTDSGTEAYTAVNETIVAIGDIPDWLPIIVIGFVGALVFMYFSGVFGTRRGAM